MFKAIVAIIFLFITNFANAAEIVQTERTEATLTSDVFAIAPKEKFHFAINLKMKSGWHTYWKNPGESGTKPVFEWVLPKGFIISEAEFPAPQILKAGDIIDYGYNDEVSFIFTVTPPEFLNNNVVTIYSLKAKWLVCKDVCIPEQGEFSISLPVSEKPLASDNSAKISEIIKNLPVWLDKEHIFARNKNNKISLNVTLNNISAEKIKSVSFFPITENIAALENAKNFVIRNKNIEFTINKNDNNSLKE
ncbi:MAG: protein-disulfide reductase DsbD domain-containing protein, partial [Pseudomonadota bacterium]